MKKDKHPPYQDVLFVDTSTGHSFVCGSTLQPKETAEFEGRKYPVCRVPISSASHPFFTGSKQLVDAEGRIDKFKKRYAAQVQQTPPPPKPVLTAAKAKKEAVKKAPAKKKTS